MIDRRVFAAVSGTALLAALGWRLFGAAPAQAGKFEISRSEEEWRKLLTPEQFQVLRKHGTERPFSSPLDKTYASGTYHCAACDLPLFASETKFDSRTGWPSFYAPIENAVGTTTDWLIGYPRTEVHCRRCGGHLGHVFDDGPKPTGKRFCMNGVSLKFVAKKPAS
ncbi:MAG: peptide-methionine (R)-S-oxide reductase MsrB [Hyphomicrobiaceae bacterium]